MKILQFCHKSPYPPKEGGPIAVNTLTEGLINAGHSVKVLAISTPKYFVEMLHATSLQKDYIDKTNFEYVYVDTSVKPVEAFLNLFSKESYNITRFISKDVEDKLKQVLTANDFDIVQLESLFVTPYVPLIRKHSKAKIVLRAHNIEYVVWERLKDTIFLKDSILKNPIKRFYINYLAKKLKNYEISMLNSYDGIATISAKDAEIYLKNGCKIPITDIPFGIDLDNYKIETFHATSLPDKMKSNDLFFIGSMDWMPNQAGVKWFINEVWTKVRNRYPELRFYLAGRNFPEWLLKINSDGSNLVILGEVEDALKFISSHSIMIVPLFSGSGVRVKIIEGLALGKTIISTTTGAEGIDYDDGKNILIANTAEEFVEKIAECINNPDLCMALERNAKELIKQKHNNEKIVEKLINFYESF